MPDSPSLPARALNRPALLWAACVALVGVGCRAVPPSAPVRAPAIAPTASASVPAGPASAEVAALTSPDFMVRSRAAEALVRLGEAALPALGAVGDLPVVEHGEVTVSATRPVIAAILERAPADRITRVHLVSESAAVRRGAADEIGRRGGWGPVPDLIDRLEDSDPAVRSAVVAALRRLTNRVYDVDAGDGAIDRSAAAARWREWWSREGRRAAANGGRSG